MCMHVSMFISVPAALSLSLCVSVCWGNPDFTYFTLICLSSGCEHCHLPSSISTNGVIELFFFFMWQQAMLSANHRRHFWTQPIEWKKKTKRKKNNNCQSAFWHNVWSVNETIVTYWTHLLLLLLWVCDRDTVHCFLSGRISSPNSNLYYLSIPLFYLQINPNSNCILI